MDISSMKTLLELQALQNFTMTNDSSANTLSSNSSLFSELINDLLNEQTNGTSDSLNGLGDVSSLQAMLESLQGNDASQSSDAASYITSFLLNSNASSLSALNFSSLNTTEESNTLVNYTTDYTGKTDFENLLAGANQYSGIISKAAQTYNIPEKLLAAVMKQESNFNPKAESGAGASGLMQLMPSTAKYLGIQDRFDPEQNIMGGAKYLRQMLDQFDDNIETALAAYNAGPGNVKKYDGIPPFTETQNYVKKVLNYYNV